MNNPSVTSDELKKIADMYRQNISLDGIADEVGLNKSTVHKHIKRMIEHGIIERRENIKKGRIDPNAACHKTVKKKKVEEDLGEGGVKCTKAIAQKCLYGTIQDWRCNYCDIEGHCRTVVDGKSGHNDPKHCNCYREATKKEKLAVAKKIKQNSILRVRRSVASGKLMSEL